MSQVLFVNVFGFGNVNPTISLVKELINRGETVTYVAGEEFREYLESTGAAFVGYKNFDESKFLNGNIALESCEPIFLEIAEIYIKIAEVIFRLGITFDYMIYNSLFFLGPQIKNKLQIPSISIFCTFATNDKVNYLSMLLSRSMVEKLRNRAEFSSFAKYIQQKYKMEVPDLYLLHMLKADLNLVYTSRYFQPEEDSFDESYQFIGPPMTQAEEIADQRFIKKDGEKLIYISLGTIFNQSVDFYKSCLKAFDHMDAKVILSVGENISVDTFGTIPSNFMVRNHVPQLEILKQADVFISHGGMNSTNEGLYYCVPLVVIPHFFDQPAVAGRVAELGAGIVIPKEQVTPKLLRQGVDRIFSDRTFQKNSEIIGKTLRDAGGYKRGVDEIFHLKNSLGLLWGEREIS
jgi:MGT family glycosyltransferase